jgi:plasmid maintenance system antidote protein VapI
MHPDEILRDEFLKALKITPSPGRAVNFLTVHEPKPVPSIVRGKMDTAQQ